MVNALVFKDVIVNKETEINNIISHILCLDESRQLSNVRFENCVFEDYDLSVS